MRSHIVEIFNAALKAVDPYKAVTVRANILLPPYGDTYYKKVYVIAFGKAASAMLKAVVDSAGESITAAIGITKYGHALYTGNGSTIRIREAGHPLPDLNGLRGTEEVVNLLGDTDEDTLVLCLISGGGSALLVEPCEGITLEDKQTATDLLLRAGADIYELNTVRKHVSNVKGGRLAEKIYPAKTISLILSDVIGDRLDVIASGPTAPDGTTYNDALQVVEKYKLADRMPRSVIDLLDKGSRGLIAETPKKDSPVFSRVENIIIGSNRTAAEAAKKKAEELGYDTIIISTEMTGEARDAARYLGKKAVEAHSREAARPVCLISGGETTVSVKGDGKGGRNTELALAFAMEIDGMTGIELLSAGTDGTDGPTDAAGAIVDGETIATARRAGLDPVEYLKNNDSYSFFRKIDGLFITGPTNTNVMDLQVILIGQ